MKKYYFLLLIIGVGLTSCTKNYPYITHDGQTQGTTYHIVYQPNDGKVLKAEIEDELKRFDHSLSTYNPGSIISRVNNNDTSVVLDDLFKRCFNQANQLSKLSDGAFDMTVAPLVNAWGFGFKNNIDIHPAVIDSIMKFVGYHKVALINDKIVKQIPQVQIDAGGIAQGFSVDVISELLEKKGVINYLVEIGGEVRAKGINSKGKIWRIGIDKPIDGSEPENRELQNIVSLKDKSLSTSGNYRAFYIKDGVKYAHTIDPKTGYPVQNRLLSASVLADNCMTADAMATICMVKGVEPSISFQKEHPEIEIFLIYTDSLNQYQTYSSSGFSMIIDE